MSFTYFDQHLYFKIEYFSYNIRYELTPVRKYKNNSNSENYNIEDIKSDDSTDDEDKPRKKIPSWATGMCCIFK